ncbi:MAG TPA: hypothetical protein VK986_11520 [Tepidisphaeraceae bacterium]|nr:hypothetical protein [Tepidisphaeraceae bacterium]
MRDLTSPRLMALKAGLFVLLSSLSAGILLWETPSWRAASLLALAVWGFARAYYFAFYVIGHYIDPSFRFAGLTSVVRYWRARARRP